MSKSPAKSPPDQAQRDKALDTGRTILVQAPAGSGKTTLLAERFLRLLAEVDEPGQIVAITFTKAAAAEMRNRILDKLREAEPSPMARARAGSTRRSSAGICSTCRRNCASQRSTRFVANSPCSSRFSPDSAGAWRSPSSQRNSIAAPHATRSSRSAKETRR